MKTIILTVLMFALSCCEIKMKEANAQSSTSFYKVYDNKVYDKERVYIDGMEYLIISVKYQSSQTGYSVATINLTKDKLEVEVLRKQLRK